MRKRTTEDRLIDTGLKVLIQGAGSILGSLYGPVTGIQDNGKCFLQLFVRTGQHIPLGDIEAGYNLHFAAANVTSRIVQIGRYRDHGNMYTIRTLITEDDIRAISSSIEYEKKRNFLLTNRKI